MENTIFSEEIVCNIVRVRGSCEILREHDRSKETFEQYTAASFSFQWATHLFLVISLNVYWCIADQDSEDLLCCLFKTWRTVRARVSDLVLTC